MARIAEDLSDKSLTQLAALEHVSRQLGSSLNLADVIKMTFEEAVAGAEADGGSISLYHESAGNFVPRHGSGPILKRELAVVLEQETSTKRKSVIRHNLSNQNGIRSVLIVPILYEGIVAGLISLTKEKPFHFDSQSVTFVTVLANYLTVSIVNAQLLQDTLNRERFYAALGRVTLAITSTVNLPSLLELICQESLALFKVDGAYIWQKQADRLVGIAAQGYGSSLFIGSSVPIEDVKVFAAAVARYDEGMFANYYSSDDTFKQVFPWQESIKAVMGVPLKREGDIIGVLELIDTTRSDRFGRQEIEQTKIFGAQAATAIQNAQLVTEMQALNEQLDERVVERTHALGEERDRVKYLLRVTTDLSASLDQDRVLIRALELINEVVKATHGSILLLDTNTGKLIYPSAFETHQLPPIPRVDLGYRPEEGLAGWIIRHRSSLIIEDTKKDDRWIAGLDNPDLRSVLAVPLISNDEVIGVLTLFHEEPHAFSQQQLELVEAAAIQVASAISNAQLYLLIRDQAERLGRMLREEHIEAAKNQAILESIADGVLVADQKGKVLLANLSASQILEIPQARLRGQNIDQLLGQYVEGGHSWMGAINQWTQSENGAQKRRYISELLSIKGKSVSLHLSPVVTNDQFFGTVSIFRDITQEVEVDRMKSEFVSTVSHELRTPMTSIKGYVELMMMGAAGLVSDDQAKYLKVIRKNADRMTTLVNDLLDISRIESGRIDLDLKAVDLVQLIRQVIDTHLKGLIEHENRNISLDLELAGSLPLVYADPDRVTQIITNLLDNAFHYTPADGKISVSASAGDGCVLVSVRDTGIGIDEENQSKIFERFFRSEDPMVQKVPGTGLGLSIVKRLVEMHGGSIELESTPGAGSTFTFNLLIADGEDPSFDDT